ncbi:hypothetical protein TNCV_4655841 [Trichonephila clavipes]|nr:hypothetical protein TNCV_4655841 [Trichonephila clavipes]
MVHRWCGQFSESCQSVHDEERSGRPSLINVELVRPRVMKNRRFTITEGKCHIDINFLVKLRKSATKTFQILTEAYRDETLPRAHVFEWYQRFTGEIDNGEDDEPAGCPRSWVGIIYYSEYKKYSCTVTRVDEWTTAEIGVGAAIAAGSQAEKGNCALLEQAANERKIKIINGN